LSATAELLVFFSVAALPKSTRNVKAAKSANGQSRISPTKTNPSALSTECWHNAMRPDGNFCLSPIRSHVSSHFKQRLVLYSQCQY